MAGDPGPPDGVRENWLVQGQAVTSGALLQAIAGDPGVHVLNRIASDTLLLEMTPTRAEQLKARFGPALIIEPDQPLDPIE
ncbi:MAG TPA: hypothetical protein VGO70_05225 [Arsenicitalea sp.]|jgi:hypothetical protein|nr:hypothetical protein [Arsenicitalea sp.]